jgi:hypothetical protein
VVGEVEPPAECAGDEYVITVTIDEPAPVSGESEAEILIQRFARDGSEGELQLEGDLNDVRDLVSILSAEGNCVKVEVRPSPDSDLAGEAPELGNGAAELGDTLEPALP